ncbi:MULTISPECIES: hypothetical protein [unclassified Bradyrhizobium]|uniref:hypothetical protein n=1 Tax=unclassified Bradyrhizobium TaxID=2631580 RepID=UPI00048DA3D0|nr:MULTISPECIES: hypothetical protein [unclassified Bradyrhizobium]QIG96336.1 hypothetical protein G6P99_30665 [Bradyrhizobium sp. 6(2017)]
MATNEGYLGWRAAVDQGLVDIYCIAVEDAGLDEEYLERHWKSKQTPTEFVQWFGNKYDLDRRPPTIRTTDR